MPYGGKRRLSLNSLDQDSVKVLGTTPHRTVTVAVASMSGRTIMSSMKPFARRISSLRKRIWSVERGQIDISSIQEEKLHHKKHTFPARLGQIGVGGPASDSLHMVFGSSVLL